MSAGARLAPPLLKCANSNIRITPVFSAPAPSSCLPVGCTQLSGTGRGSGTMASPESLHPGTLRSKRTFSPYRDQAGRHLSAVDRCAGSSERVRPVAFSQTAPFHPRPGPQSRGPQEVRPREMVQPAPRQGPRALAGEVTGVVRGALLDTACSVHLTWKTPFEKCV